MAVKLDQSLVLFDLGYGALEKLPQAYLYYKKVEALFFSHLHCDHLADLIPFLLATKNTPGFTRRQELLLCGPTDLKASYEGLVSVYRRQSQTDSYRILLEELQSGQVFLERGRVLSRPVLHTPTA